jgi:signal transduction histidine kinase/CheY-like chemotaxis protein
MYNKNVESEKNLHYFFAIYLFLLIAEAINIYFAYATGVGSFYNFILPIIYIGLGLIFIFKFESSEKKVTYFSLINIFIIWIFLTLHIIFKTKIFFSGIFLFELGIILVFSNLKLINKIIILLLISLQLVFAHIYLGFASNIVNENILFIIGLFIIILFSCIISDRIIQIYNNLIKESLQKSEELQNTNQFLKTILNQEKIRILYFYPDNNSALLFSDNFEFGSETKIDNFLTYLRTKKIIPLEYFGVVQNAIETTKIEGKYSIILPVNLKDTSVWMEFNGTKDLDTRTNRERLIISITSINDRKLVELKFKNALKQCSIAIWEYDISKDKIYNYSDPVLEYYFYGKNLKKASQTIISRNIIYSKDLEIFKEGFNRVQNGATNVSFEFRIFPTRNSSYTWVRANFTCFKDNQDNPTIAWVSIENIDDAKASEKWVEIERNKNLDTRSGLLAMAELNISRNFVISYSNKYVNDELEDNSIITMLDSFVKGGFDIEGKENLYTVINQDYLLDLYNQGQRVIEQQFKVITSSNDILYISNVVKLYLDLKTKEIIAFLFFYDITESAVTKLAMESILNSKFVYLAYVNILNSHMSISRTQLFDVTNASNLFRIYKDEWIVFIEKYVHPDDKEYVYKCVDIENVRKQIKYKKSFNFSYRITDGGNMITMRRCHFVRSDKRSPYIIILEENISNEMISRIKHELVLKDALKQATEAAKAKSEFLSRMSHEIRTPLSAIIGLSELGVSSIDSDNKDYFNKINDSGQYLLGLMNDILDMNKIELGQVTLNSDYIDTEEFYEVILTIIRNQASRKNIKFDFIKNGPQYRYQYLEKLRVQQILLNVLNNAIKYTPNNGHVVYTITNVNNNGDKYVVHEVKDNGVGISQDFIKNVFNPFTRERNSLSDTEGGTGLGLAICSNLVKQLNGDIKIESVLNEGTTITITLPLTVTTKDKYIEETKDDSKIDNGKMFYNKKILVAEDHQVNAMIILTILNNRGIVTDHVINGEDAVREFSNSQENEYDMILMDIMMPKLNGLDAAKKIRELDREDAKKVPIIALSANAFEEDKKRSLEFGMNDHLKKPIEIPILIKTLDKYL